MPRSYDDLSLEEKIKFIDATPQEAAAMLDMPYTKQAVGIIASMQRSGDIGRLMEEKRQADIESAVGKIGEAFGRFDEPYYSKLKSDYLGFAEPQIASQYEQARRQLAFKLARGPGAASSVGARATGGLGAKLEQARAGAREKALGIEEKSKADIEKLKSALIQQAYGGEGLGELGEMATTQVLSATQQPEYSPIGDIFGMAAYAAPGQSARTRVSDLYSATPGTSRIVR